MKGADILKFIFALVVVWIHTGTNDLHGLVNIAVPFFFVMSGFFLFGKIFTQPDSISKQSVLLKWLKSTIRLYLLWTLIYLPFAIIGFYKEGLPLIKSTVVWLRNVLLVGENYLSWPLWYLLGMIWAGIVILLSIKLRIPFWLLCIGGVILFLAPRILPAVFENKYYLSSFQTTRNGFFHGLPFMLLGGVVRKVLPSIKGWRIGSWQQKIGMYLRFYSVHIYLTHMLWAGFCMLYVADYKRGVLLWGGAVIASLLTGFIVGLLPALQKFLYGRVYVPR